MRSEGDGDGYSYEWPNAGNGWGILSSARCPQFARGNNFGDDDSGNGNGDSAPVGYPDGQLRYGRALFGNEAGDGP